MPTVTAVINAHHEGMLAGMSIASFGDAVDEAQRAGIAIEPIIVLDRPDAITVDIFRSNPIAGARVDITDFGDPALSRNHAARLATGKYITYLDADDLWSFNWITAATAMCEAAPAPFIAQSEMNWVFGEANNFWIHADSTAAGFDPSYMAVGNYWDAMVFTWCDIMREHPFEKNDLKQGYGHEDWHWHTRMMLAGIEHRPVAGTMHMKRRRAGSQMALCTDSDVVPFHTSIYRLARERMAPRQPAPALEG